MALDINIGLSVTATGTVDAITCTASPAPASLTDKLKYFVKALGANTSTTPTFAPNGLTSRTIVKKGGQALVAGDIYGAGAIIILQYDLANTRWELLNPVFTDGLDTYLVQSGNNLLVKSGKYFQSQAYTNGWIYSDANEGSIGFDDGADINSFTAKLGRVYIEQSAVKVFDSAAAGTQLNHGTLINFAAPSVKKNGSELATQSYVDGLVVGLLDDRGSYDASVNTFPAAGGSGTAGAILKGDIWYISVAGTLGGSAVTVGDSVRALVDTPGQTATNWSILETNIGYVPANVANNLSDLSNAATARINLGLGDSATKNLGTTSGTVLEGNRIQTAIMASPQTTTSNVLADVTELVLPVEANKSYTIDSMFLLSGSGPNGMNLTITFPSGSTINIQATGSTSDQVQRAAGRILASAGLSPAFDAVNDTTPIGFGELKGSFQTTNSGNIQVQFKSVTNTQSKTIDAGSFIRIFKIN